MQLSGKKTKVTIITPTYNRANLITETIDSILAQDFKDFEYLILDDGSTDNTKKVVEPYLVDNRVKYLRQENKGEPETVNWGWGLANGEYFTQVNSDDPVMPNFLSEMIKAMDKNPDKVLAYPDFNFIDVNGKVISVTKSPNWDFKDALCAFSCYAASPGTFIRRSVFKDLKTIKRSRFKHINDVEMYWDMALMGDFLHVPKVLANWRAHLGQISTERYKAIPEIEQWFEYYFSKDDLPKNILELKPKVRESILNYFISLIHKSNLKSPEKRIAMKPYLEELKLPTFEFNCLQIGDNDLIGNKFNGHDLHIYLRKKGIEANHLVNWKQSRDENTFTCKFSTSNFTEGIIKNKLFLESDIVHLHLIHNTPFDLDYFPIVTRLKPTVITLHDPFFLGGHCIYHLECEKWKEHCLDCSHLDKPFAIEHDDTALKFELKRWAIQNSQITAIVASKWMEEKVRQSPIWKGKKIYYLPFGINQEIFKPTNVYEMRKKLGIDSDSIVLMFRADGHPYKGLDIIKKALSEIHSGRKITILTVKKEGNLDGFKNKFQIIEYGWVKDDKELSELYQACDIFLMPSRQETFGMMAIEAMSCGKTVLATEGTALENIIHSPECGLAVDEDDYTNALQNLINDPQELMSRGEKSLEFAQKNYNKEDYVSKMIEIYKEIIVNHKKDDVADLILEQLNKYCVRDVSEPAYSPLNKFAHVTYRAVLRPVLQRIYGNDIYQIDSFRN